MDTQIYAVLTGDLVKSTNLSSEASTEAMEWLRKAALEFTEIYPKSMVGQLDTFRHDSWQMLMSQPKLAFRAACFLRASLRQHSDREQKFDTRISIGIGRVETIAQGRISDSRGAAFTASGKGLDAMKHDRLAFVGTELSNVFHAETAKVVMALLDCVISDWTSRESQAVCGALQRWTQATIAENWHLNPKRITHITRQAVGLSLDRAHWRVVEDTLKWLEVSMEKSQELA